ncbi:hypothetical protein ACHMW6_08495 [Pseudoduganella sp. UC29_106]|uniref:hypothetical protein n=1 Tax=Pseudoduganella sp. UC29_106 TaxID=3374553 RepID=UPI0037565075
MKILALTIALAAHAAAADLPCGLGAPPGTKGFAAQQAREADEVARKGYLTVCEANLERYDVRSNLTPLASASKGLAFKPVDLSNTPFARLQALGGVAEAVGDVKSRFYRGFRDAKGRTVTLFEHDMSADGVRAYRNPKDEPERVNGLPARLVVLQAQKKAASVLSWTEGRRYYELWIDTNVVLDRSRPELFALAASLPKAIPAKPNGPTAAPFVLGPDGLPVIQPPVPAPPR